MFADESLRDAIKALDSDDFNGALRSISRALSAIFESGELPELATTPYDDIPNDLNNLVDALEST